VQWGGSSEGGFTMNVVPPEQSIAPRGVATYTVQPQPSGSFSHTIALLAHSPSPSLTLKLSPASIPPSGQATLTVTNTHAGFSLLPGIRYTIPITAVADSIVQTATARLLVGGQRVYLPLVLKGF